MTVCLTVREGSIPFVGAKLCCVLAAGNGPHPFKVTPFGLGFDSPTQLQYHRVHLAGPIPVYGANLRAAESSGGVITIIIVSQKPRPWLKEI